MKKIATPQSFTEALHIYKYKNFPEIGLIAKFQQQNLRHP